jgi:hypothetical protein
VDRASAIAVDLGWQPRHRVTPGFRRVKHAAPFDHRAGVACDVHWRVFEEPGGGTADDEFRAAAETVVFQGTRLRVPTPADQLRHTCGHAARWAPGPGIHWVADAMHIVRAGSIDWKRLVGQAVQRRFVLRMRHMLAYLRQALEAPIPADVEADLARRRVSPLERLEHRVRSRERRVLGEFAAYVFNCARGERHPLLAFPGYLRDAWDLPSTGRVLPHALALVARRVGAAMARGD